MNQTKQKERENYEPPVVTDIAPIAVGSGTGGSGEGTGDNDDISDGWGG